MELTRDEIDILTQQMETEALLSPLPNSSKIDDWLASGRPEMQTPRPGLMDILRHSLGRNNPGFRKQDLPATPDVSGAVKEGLGYTPMGRVLNAADPNTAGLIGVIVESLTNPYLVSGSQSIEDGIKEVDDGKLKGNQTKVAQGLLKVLGGSVPLAKPSAVGLPVISDVLGHLDLTSPAYAGDGGDPDDSFDFTGAARDFYKENPWLAPVVGGALSYLGVKGYNKIDAQPSINRLEQKIADDYASKINIQDAQRLDNLQYKAPRTDNMKSIDYGPAIANELAKVQPPRYLDELSTDMIDSNILKNKKSIQDIEDNSEALGSIFGAGIATGSDVYLRDGEIDAKTLLSTIPGAILGGSALNPKSGKARTVNNVDRLPSNEILQEMLDDGALLGQRQKVRVTEPKVPLLDSDGAMIPNKTGGTVEFRWPDDIRKAAHNMLENGATDDAISKALNVPPGTPKNWRKKWKNEKARDIKRQEEKAKKELRKNPQKSDK